MPALTSLALGGGALLGGLGGLVGSNSSTSVNAGNATSTETNALNSQNALFHQLNGLAGAGPGQQDVSNALNSQHSLSQLLQQYTQSGGLPSQQDQSQANGFAGQVFAGQRNMLNQQFQAQDVDTQRLAARLGRSASDPVLRAKLLQSQSQMFNQLAADQTSFGANLGLGMADRRAGFASQAAQVDQGLANQAIQNRAALLGIGSNIAQSERNFRLGTATQTQSKGGGLGGFLGGLVGGAGAGLSIGQGLDQAFGGAGGLGTEISQQAGGVAMPSVQFGQSATSGRTYNLGGR
jgi:hypothetical protein